MKYICCIQIVTNNTQVLKKNILFRSGAMAFFDILCEYCDGCLKRIINNLFHSVNSVMIYKSSRIFFYELIIIVLDYSPTGITNIFIIITVFREKFCRSLIKLLCVIFQ